MDNKRPMHRIRYYIITLLLAGSLSAGIAQEESRQSVVVHGTVLDGSTGVPVEGISIRVPGYASAFTDSIGAFSIEVPHDQSSLYIDGPGYQSRQFLLKGKEEVSVLIHEKGYHSQDELAHYYYFARPLALATQSVVSLDLSDRTWKQPATSAEKMINQEVPGLRILSRSGIPGAGSNMFLRGYSSLYSTNQPLIVLDGHIYETAQVGIPIIGGFQPNPLNSINAGDIENITVIRDAASIYGSRGSGGVIFIRTSDPSEIATKIDFSVYGGLNFTPEQIPLLAADDYRTYVAEILQTSGITADSLYSLPFMIDDPEYREYYRYHNETNWQDEVFSNSTNQNINLKITGGDEIALYALSVGYQKHEGIIRETDYSRYAFRFNSVINISSRLKLRTNLGFTFNQHLLQEDGQEETNPFHASLVKAPFLYPNVRSSTGAVSPNFEDADIFGVGNPAAMIQDMSATSNNYRILGSVDLGYSFSEHFSVNNYLGINFDKSRDNLFVPYLGTPEDTTALGIIGNRVAHKVERYFNIYDDLRLNYMRTLGWKHHVHGLAGARFGINRTEGDWGMDYNTPNDQIRSLGNGVSSLREVDGYFGDWNWVTFYGMVGYDYAYKYLLNVNLALDGSSRFGEEAGGLSLLGGTFGVFPSVAAAWLVTSEPFLADAGFLDLLKLRISFGLTGNDDIGNYTATKYYKSQNFLGSEGLVKGNLYNPALRWETVTKLNGGIDMMLLGERLSVGIDLFRNKTTDLINVISASPMSGFENYIDNNGSFTSSGMEGTVHARILNTSLKWDAGFILSKYRTELVEFSEESRITELYGANILSRIGEPISQFYGYRALGVFSTVEEADAAGLRARLPNTDLVPFSAGDIHFEDVNQDQVIDEQDMQVIGDPNPDLTGIFYSTLSWKGITLEAGMDFSYGNDVYNHMRHQLESMQNTDNQTEAIMNRWRGEGQKTDVPRATWEDPVGNARFSDLWIEDGSFLRLRYVTLSYKFPFRARFLNNIEIFISGHNLVTFTSYLGLDPDFSLSGATLAQGIDIGMTPQPKSVYMGIKIGL